MNLDELKVELQKQVVKEPVRSTKNFSAILANNHSVSIVNKIRRSLFFEIIVSALAALSSAVLALIIHTVSFAIYFGIAAVVAAVFAVVLFYLYRSVNSLAGNSLPLKQNLQNIVQVISEYQQRYFQFSVALMPVTVSLAIGLAYMDNSAQLASLENVNLLLPFSIAIIVACAGIFYFNKWSLKNLYGNYLQELKSFLKELEE